MFKIKKHKKKIALSKKKQMIIRFRGYEIIKTNEELLSFKSNWYNNQLQIQIPNLDKIPSNVDLEFIDQIKTVYNLKNIPDFFYKIADKIYQRKLVSCCLQGGLGNRLFQLAAIINYASKNHKTAVIALDLNKKNQHSGIDYISSLFQNIPLVNRFPNPNCKYIEKPEHFSTYQHWPSNKNNHILFNGYFQSCMYVPENFQKFLLFPEVTTKDEWAFVHIRRGDYVKHPFYVQMSNLYYLNCLHQIKVFQPSVKIMIISDDIKWCMQQQIFENADKFDTDSKNELEALVAMGNCLNGGICSNSTFAWWGSWIAKQKTNNPYIQFMPYKWLTNNWKTEYSFPSTIVSSNDPPRFLPTLNSIEDFYLKTNFVYALFAEKQEYVCHPNIKEFFKHNITFDVLCLSNLIGMVEVKNEWKPFVAQVLEGIFDGSFKSCPQFILSRTGAKKILTKSPVNCFILES